MNHIGAQRYGSPEQSGITQQPMKGEKNDKRFNSIR
jgi:hypothetical protein